MVQGFGGVGVWDSRQIGVESIEFRIEFRCRGGGRVS